MGDLHHLKAGGLFQGLAHHHRDIHLVITDGGIHLKRDIVFDESIIAGVAEDGLQMGSLFFQIIDVEDLAGLHGSMQGVGKHQITHQGVFHHIGDPPYAIRLSRPYLIIDTGPRLFPVLDRVFHHSTEIPPRLHEVLYLPGGVRHLGRIQDHRRFSCFSQPFVELFLFVGTRHIVQQQTETESQKTTVGLLGDVPFDLLPADLAGTLFVEFHLVAGQEILTLRHILYGGTGRSQQCDDPCQPEKERKIFAIFNCFFQFRCGADPFYNKYKYTQAIRIKNITLRESLYDQQK